MTATLQTQLKTDGTWKPSFMPMRSGRLQRKCACGSTPGPTGECEDCRKKRLQRKATQPSTLDSHPSEVPPIVHEALRSPGRPLDSETRAFMEPRFGHDFSKVRVHTGADAKESAHQVDALAYTLGTHVVFADSPPSIRSIQGQLLWGHELSHVVQQRGWGGNTSPGDAIGIGADNRLESEADHAAQAVSRHPTNMPAHSSAGRILMRLTPVKFREQLGATVDQKAATDTLFGNTSFLGLWNYMKACKATPVQDLGPVELKVTPGLKIGGAERYGGYFSLSRTLEINPTKPEHAANPTELVDTVVHEFIHAVSDLEPDCVKAGAKPAPLGGAATASPPTLAAVKGTADEDKWLTEVGPGASNPCEEFIDINKAAQDIIIAILKENIRTAKVGRPTITFVNDALRREPKALAEYKKCRDIACAKPTATQRSKEIAICSEAIMAKYVSVPTPPKAANANAKKKGP